MECTLYVIFILSLNILQVSKRIAGETSMGYVMDDPTKPQDVGDAAKAFFNSGKAASFMGSVEPRCCPIFTANNHILDWLKKPKRDR